MALAPNINEIVNKVANELKNPARDTRIPLQTRIWNAVRAASSDKSMHRQYFFQVQQKLSRRSATKRSAVAAARKIAS